MERSGIVISSVLVLVILSSGCSVLDSSNSGAETLVEEGNVVTYENLEGETFELVFFNETEQSIGLHLQFVGHERVPALNVSKANWTSRQSHEDEFLFSAALAPFDQERVTDLMEGGGDAEFSGYQENFTLTRSEISDWKGFKAYNVTFKPSDVGTFTVHAEEPFLILVRPGSHKLVSVNQTDVDQYNISYEETESSQPRFDVVR